MQVTSSSPPPNYLFTTMCTLFSATAATSGVVTLPKTAMNHSSPGNARHAQAIAIDFLIVHQQKATRPPNAAIATATTQQSLKVVMYISN